MASETPERSLWVGVPWTIQAYLVVTLAATVAYLALVGDPFKLIISLLISFVIYVGMARGSRLAWLIAVGLASIGVLGAVSFVVSEVTHSVSHTTYEWLQVLWLLLTLGALLHPLTRAWCNRRLQLV